MERPPNAEVITASPAATPCTTPAETVAIAAADEDQVADNVASSKVPSLFCASSLASPDCPEAMVSCGCGRHRSASTPGGPTVTVTGVEDTLAPAASVALATKVMMLPAAAFAFAVTEKVPPTVWRDPEMLAGAATVAGPAAESDNWVIVAPAVFHALATAWSEPPACSVARLSGEVIATSLAVMLIGAEVTLLAVSEVPALTSRPVAPLLSVKDPSDFATKGMWNTALPPPGMVCAAVGEPACVAVALAEMPDSATSAALASPSFRTATETSIASPR